MVAGVVPSPGLGGVSPEINLPACRRIFFSPFYYDSRGRLFCAVRKQKLKVVVDDTWYVACSPGSLK